jgi:hypothetical protein
MFFHTLLIYKTSITKRWVLCPFFCLKRFFCFKDVLICYLFGGKKTAQKPPGDLRSLLVRTANPVPRSWRPPGPRNAVLIFQMTCLAVVKSRISKVLILKAR